MGKRDPPIDLVSILEALYRVEQSREAWLRDVMRAVQNSLHADAGVGVTIYSLPDSSGVTLEHIDVLDAPEGWLEIGIRQHANSHLQPEVRRGYEELLCADLTAQIVGPHWETGFKEAGIKSLGVLNACDASMRGAAVFIFSHGLLPIRPNHWAVLGRVATHLATSFRLHKRIAMGSAPVEAIFNQRGIVQHAEGDAAKNDSLVNLARAIERCRLAARPDEDVNARVLGWQGLVRNRWSLVSHRENDGREYFHALENVPHDQRGKPLSDREAQVVRLAALGRHNKLIAYELGLAHSTVRVLLARAARKVGVATRSELIQRIRSEPLEADR